MLALAGVLILFLAANVGLVNLDRAAFATDRTSLGIVGRLAQAMEQEPRRFVVRAKHALQLTGAHLLLAGRHELGR